MPDCTKKFRHVHLVGSGGVGMFAIGGILLEQHIKVSGSDLEKNPKSEFLRSHGAEIFYGHRADNLAQSVDALVFTSAASAQNPEMLLARQRGVACFGRGQFLAEKILPEYERSVAVAGSHGKSTVTAMITHALRRASVKVGCLIGGSLQNGELPFGAGDGSLFVTEADESDNSHALLHPTIGVITNYDADHAWTAEMEREQLSKFRTYCENSQIIIHFDTPELNEISAPFAYKRRLISVKNVPESRFGGFMRLNAVLAMSVIDALGFEADMKLLDDFEGVDRRMKVHAEDKMFILIEDYAHHPVELAASLDYLREIYNDCRIHVIFQPHRYARLKKYFDDFVAVLNEKADKVFVVPVFAAWNESGFPDSPALAAALRHGEFMDWNDADKLAAVRESGKNRVLIAVIGAGDVEKLIPVLKKDFENAE